MYNIHLHGFFSKRDFLIFKTFPSFKKIKDCQFQRIVFRYILWNVDFIIP